MRRVIVAVVAAALAVLWQGPASAQGQGAAEKEPEFTFYGLRFGMSPDEVRAVMPTDPTGTDVLKPGHGMMYLGLTYDWRNRLSEIRASYERPGERLRETAMRQVLREKFIGPIGTRWKSVTVDIDENFNRAAFTLVLVSTTMRQEAVDHFKEEYRKALE